MKVVTLALNLPGPLAAARLAGLGAEVLKVEPPMGDQLAVVAPDWYAELHEQVETIGLDLKDAGDRATLEAHLADADVLITAQRPSSLVRLGLDQVTTTHPRLVHVEIVGHAGDRAETPGHDLTYQAEHGTLAPPMMPVVPIADLLGGEYAVSTALAALMDRERTGRGGRHRVALEDSARLAGAAVRHGLMGAGAVLGGALPTYSIYPSADGHLALGALEPHFARRVHEHIGTTADELANAFVAHPNEHWEALAAHLDIPLVPISVPEPSHRKVTHP